MEILKSNTPEIQKNFAKFRVADTITTAEAIVQSDTMILVLCPVDEMYEYMQISDTLSIGAAVENMLLTATSFGLGTLWIGNVRYIRNEILEHLGLDKARYELITAVTVGYSAENSPPRPRKSVADVTIKSPLGLRAFALRVRMSNYNSAAPPRYF